MAWKQKGEHLRREEASGKRDGRGPCGRGCIRTRYNDECDENPTIKPIAYMLIKI